MKSRIYLIKQLQAFEICFRANRILRPWVLGGKPAENPGWMQRATPPCQSFRLDNIAAPCASVSFGTRFNI